MDLPPQRKMQPRAGFWMMFMVYRLVFIPCYTVTRGDC